MSTAPASMLHVALLGNPNCGKTALFNLLTGSRQKVANYAGVTVERGWWWDDPDPLRVLRVNLETPVQMVRLVLPEMKARRSGHIVNIGSVVGFAIGIGLAAGLRLAVDNAIANAVKHGDATRVQLSAVSSREGVEIAGSYDVTDAVSLGANYTYLEAFNADGTVEARRPQHKLALNATARLLDGRATVSGDVLHVRDTYDQTFFGTGYVSELPDYTVVNVAGSYDLNDRARVTARVENLFDEDYEEIFSFATPGRAAYGGVKARF